MQINCGFDAHQLLKIQCLQYRSLLCILKFKHRHRHNVTSHHSFSLLWWYRWKIWGMIISRASCDVKILCMDWMRNYIRRTVCGVFLIKSTLLVRPCRTMSYMKGGCQHRSWHSLSSSLSLKMSRCNPPIPSSFVIVTFETWDHCIDTFDQSDDKTKIEKQ